MGNINSALPSPRIDENGVIHWYKNDEFEIGIKLNLYDCDDEEIKLLDTDEVEIEIRRWDNSPLYIFKFTNIVDNYVTMVFDETVTKLFDFGKYRYDIRVLGSMVRTIANDNIMKVE